MDQQTDTIYQAYDKNLYLITGGTLTDPLLSPDPTQNLANSVNVPADSIGSGVDTSVTQQGVGNLSATKETYGDGSSGYWLGIDKDGVAKISIGPSSGNHITFDGTTLTVTGSVNIGSLNIPDTTTANSFHVDTTGNTWWGANVATGYTGAKAYILNTGQAVFQNVAIGGTTIQYVITNSGIFSYGDASDGVVTISVNTTLTSDVYYNSLTVNAGVTLNPGGYRIFVKDTLTANGAISGNGGNGLNGANGNAGGAGGNTGPALADGYLRGSQGSNGSGGVGYQSAPAAVGGTGQSTTNSLGANGSAGGAGGASSNDNIPPTTSAKAGGAGGTATASNVKLIANWHLANLLDIILVDGSPTGYKRGQTISFDNSAAAGGGGGGGGSTLNGSTNGGGGGGGGIGGRILAIYARNIVIGATGSITSNGGNGGNGGVGQTVLQAGGGGGGGGGGNGGVIVLVYNQLTNNGSITASAGSKGTGGLGGTNNGFGAGSPGTDGNNGSAGVIYQFQLSL